MTLIFAHRGSAGTDPENTMIAFMSAEKAGADGIELDVHLSKDGEIVVIHDLTVDRTTNGSGKVRDLTFTELKQLHANYHFKHFLKPVARIPSLREVFDWLKTNRLLCNIEIKNNHFSYDGIEEKVIELIKQYRFEERIMISSFNHDSLVYIKKLYADIETAPLFSDRLFEPWTYAEYLGAKGIHPHFGAVTDQMIQASMQAGIAVRPYTVNKEKDVKRLLKLHCSAIITDYPEKAVKLREQKQN